MILDKNFFKENIKTIEAEVLVKILLFDIDLILNAGAI